MTILKIVLISFSFIVFGNACTVNPELVLYVGLWARSGLSTDPAEDELDLLSNFISTRVSFLAWRGKASDASKT